MVVAMKRPRARKATELNPIRFSHLRAFGVSAAHGRMARTRDTSPTSAMALGTALHKLLLTKEPVVAYPGKVRAGKEYKAFCEANPGAEILTTTDYKKVKKMVASVRANNLAKPLLRGTKEKTLLFEWFGRKCRATPDVLGKGFIMDLKTCQSSHPDKFPWSARRLAYHAQLAFYRIAAREMGRDASNCYIVAVESTAPYPVTVFHITESSLLEGEKCLTLWMERLIQCEEANYYPAYTDALVPMDMPQDIELDFGEEATEEDA